MSGLKKQQQHTYQEAMLKGHILFFFFHTILDILPYQCRDSEDLNWQSSDW